MKLSQLALASDQWRGRYGQVVPACGGSGTAREAARGPILGKPSDPQLAARHADEG
jgi:hypothetical protein